MGSSRHLSVPILSREQSFKPQTQQQPNQNEHQPHHHQPFQPQPQHHHHHHHQQSYSQSVFASHSLSPTTPHGDDRERAPPGRGR